ncbi:BZ3500_MvSof-1268-A1-R1_Chr2-1g04604 [Microbotryum saponariae]|uniref:BZ3500_MvSof-1268-A1-R1_Chr2-1g04604 protein n=1 Tax=Microbotryum saponariae TaxID=289078 RepID=A0A2X0K804_9BASI|nr:BZ3500_MvSof-1268-A1-R1_Chr2-1g04604 [Microbotryum saponariae]SCZ92124.1 BZ3501_MvSof-1269-A2-R1_Chr2-1g04260 [Microbotryum saponariae]
MAGTSRTIWSYASRIASTSTAPSSTTCLAASHGTPLHPITRRTPRRFVSSSSTATSDGTTPPTPSSPPSQRKTRPGPPSKSSPVSSTSTPRGEAHGSLHPRDRARFAKPSTPSEVTTSSTIEASTSAVQEGSEPATVEEPVASTSTSTPNASKAIPASDTSGTPPTHSSTCMVISPNSSSDSSSFPPPPPPHQPIPVPRIPFSTHRFVRQLEHNSINKALAIDLMRATKELLLVKEEQAMKDLVGKQELENEAYLFTAALQELKTGSQIKSRNDGIALRSMTAVLQRETDAISQKMKEDMQRLQSDIQLDMNSRKEETSGELKQLDVSIMDLNSKFTILLGEVRTEIEATKWISTRRVMSTYTLLDCGLTQVVSRLGTEPVPCTTTAAIVVVVVCVVAYISAGPSSPTPKIEPPPPPSIEELGLSDRAGEEAEVTPPGGWSFWGSAPATATADKGVKRVGEEGTEGDK